MDWTKPQPSSSSVLPTFRRAAILAVAAYLSLVAGLIGCVAALTGLMIWQFVRPARLPAPEPEPEFRFVR